MEVGRNAHIYRIHEKKIGEFKILQRLGCCITKVVVESKCNTESLYFPYFFFIPCTGKYHRHIVHIFRILWMSCDQCIKVDENFRYDREWIKVVNRTNDILCTIFRV